MNRTTKPFFAMLALGMFLASGALAGDKKVIAVGQPSTDWAHSRSCHGFHPSYANTLAKSLRSRIAQTRVFKVVSRAQMAKILKEHEMGMTGLMDPEKVKSLGKMLQADYMLGVEMLCQPNFVEINVNLWDVETAEAAWTKVYEMRDLGNVSRALRDITKLIKKYGKSGTFDDSARNEIFQIVDSKAFYGATDYLLDRIRESNPKAKGKIKEVNVYGEKLTVDIRSSRRKAWAGLKFKVTDGDEERGWVFLKESGRGELEAGTLEDMSAFEEGYRVSSEDFEPTVAIGFIEDVEGGREEMVEKFKERLLEIMDEAEGLQPAEGSKVQKILMRMGERPRKKDLAKLHKAGVDLLIVGKFLGREGQRKLDFDVLSTYDGKKVISIERDRIGL